MKEKGSKDDDVGTEIRRGKSSRVKIDNRFKSMFTDERFNLTYTIDKRGRKVNTSSKEDFKRYYTLQSEEEKEEESGKEEVECAEGSSGETDTASEFDDSDLEIEHDWSEEVCAGISESTSVLALCNLDWDCVRCCDLFVLFHSLKPNSGSIHSVSIYRSELGKEHLKEEALFGPKELREASEKLKNLQSYNEEDMKNDPIAYSYHQEKLRQYQFKRLKYAYAIIKCDSTQTTDHIYNEFVGVEYELSGNRLDLRYVQDDMTFDDADLIDTCQVLPSNINTNYMPCLYFSKALKQTKVSLTWDENNPGRVKDFLSLHLVDNKKIKSKHQMNDINNMDMEKYIASSGPSSEDDNDGLDVKVVKKKNRYRNLLFGETKEFNEDDLNDENASEEDGDMEITWNVDLDNKVRKSALNKEKKSDSHLTPFEKFLEKKKDSKKKRQLRDVDKTEGSEAEEDHSEDDENKKKLELIVMSEDEFKDGRNDRHFSLKELLVDSSVISKSKAKRLAKKKLKNPKTQDSQKVEDAFKICLHDVRFHNFYTSHHFAIDPCNENFKKTAGMLELLNERSKVSLENTSIQNNLNDLSKKSAQDEVSSLVKSIKSKMKKV